MKATVKRGNTRRMKSTKEIVRDAGKATVGGPSKRGTRRGTARTTGSRGKIVNYPVAETLRWVSDGEKLLIKWGAIKSPGAKRHRQWGRQGAVRAGGADRTPQGLPGFQYARALKRPRNRTSAGGVAIAHLPRPRGGAFLF